MRSAELYRTLRPELMISGHWSPYEVTDGYLDMLLSQGEKLARLHREILPREVDFDAEGFGARIAPYRSAVVSGGVVPLRVEVRNPFSGPDRAVLRTVLPAGWSAEPPVTEVELRAGEVREIDVRVRIPGDCSPAERVRIAVDLTVGGMAFGQQAEALVSVR